MDGARMLQPSVIVAILSLFLNLATAVVTNDIIYSSQPLTRNKTIVSSGQLFELGFFSPGNSKKWFIGIWYKKFPKKTKTFVWVANRDNPLSSPTGTLKINKKGKLTLTNKSGKTFWQSNQTTSSSNTVGQILDTGNFVLRRENDSDPRNYLWQSFDYPTDTLLPGMKLGLDKKTGLNRFLTSWKNNDDPSSGVFSFKLNYNGFPELILRKDQTKVYRSGPWNGLRFSSVLGLGASDFMNFTFVMDKNEDTYSFQMTDLSKYLRFSLNSFGVLQRFLWIQMGQRWHVLWYAPYDHCDMYKECGAFGICNINNVTLCRCINGFQPKYKKEWSLRDGSEGCARTIELNCPTDGFTRIDHVKLPEGSNVELHESLSLEDCRNNCQNDCSCTAYASMDVRSGGSGCVTWKGDLVDLRKYAASKGGQPLYVRVPNILDDGTGKEKPESSSKGHFEHVKRFWEAWDLRIFIILSLMSQIVMVFLAPFRKSVSSMFLSFPLWLAYLVPDNIALYALGIIYKSKTHEPVGPYATPHLLALWASFLLIHLGGPDTITAFALEDNELWIRHLLGLMFQGYAVSYTFVRTMPDNPNKIMQWIQPSYLMCLAGLIKNVERIRSLYLASTQRFRSSLLTDPDPGPNYAKLMDEYSSKKLAKLPTKIEMTPEPKRVKTTAPEVKGLTDLEIVQAAHQFFSTFKGLVADMIFSFRERTESRAFFLQRTPRDAFKVVEVELNFIYEILYTKIVVVHGTTGYILRLLTICLTCASLLLFFLLRKYKIERYNMIVSVDKIITYTLHFVAIALDCVAFIMAFTSDWTAVMLLKKDNILFKHLRVILRVDRDRWPDKKQPDKKQPGKKPGCIKIFSSMFMQFVAKHVGIDKFREIMSRRWSGLISQYNLIDYCLNPRSKLLDKVINWLGLTNMADGIEYVNTKKVDDEIRDFIFKELKMKSEVAEDLETAKEINSARGDWTLRVNGNNDLLPWINDVDYDESLLLWHIATDLCYNSDNEVKNEPTNVRTYRRFAKILSDHMLALLMTESTLMSPVAGIGEKRFRDTCAEAKKFFELIDIYKEKEENKETNKKERRDNKKEKEANKKTNKNERKDEKKEEMKDEEPDKTHVKACLNLLDVKTEVKPITLKGDKSKSVLFDACMLAKELKKLEEGEKWEIMSKVWVELLCYAASRCRPTTHVAQLSKGGQFITLVWLLMAHFGLGNQFQVSEGYARAKIIIGK